jgi:hypothetical protein
MVRRYSNAFSPQYPQFPVATAICPATPNRRFLQWGQGTPNWLTAIAKKNAAMKIQPTTPYA